MATTTLILLVEIDEDTLPKGSAYTELPDQLYDMVEDFFPAAMATLKKVYLANPKVDVDKFLVDAVLDYHHYAVSVRGERCEEDDCEQHPRSNLVLLHGDTQRASSPPGIN